MKYDKTVGLINKKLKDYIGTHVHALTILSINII